MKAIALAFLIFTASFLSFTACIDSDSAPIERATTQQATECRLPTISHTCDQLPCLTLDCTVTTSGDAPRCKCTLPVGTPLYVADCYGS
jgi:hypothetical protein